MQFLRFYSLLVVGTSLALGADADHIVSDSVSLPGHSMPCVSPELLSSQSGNLLVWPSPNLSVSQSTAGPTPLHSARPSPAMGFNHSDFFSQNDKSDLIMQNLIDFPVTDTKQKMENESGREVVASFDRLNNEANASVSNATDVNMLFFCFSCEKDAIDYVSPNAQSYCNRGPQDSDSISWGGSSSGNDFNAGCMQASLAEGRPF